jgi:aminoglycoside phosphotransferase (APT) family kinase protein
VTPGVRAGGAGPPGLADLERVRDLLATRPAAPPGPLRAELLAGGRSNLTYLVTDGNSRWVLRRPPLGGLTPSAHDMAREYRVVSALYGHVLAALHAVPYREVGLGDFGRWVGYLGRQVRLWWRAACGYSAERPSGGVMARGSGMTGMTPAESPWSSHSKSAI